MKKILFLTLTLFLVLPIWAWGVTIVGTSGVGYGLNRDTSILEAHFENSDDVTVGTPAGYSSNATKTWTKVGTAAYSGTQKSDGSYSLYLAAVTDKASIATADVRAAGTLVIDAYMASHVNWGYIASYYIGAANKLEITLTDVSGSARITYQGGGVDVHVDTTGITYGSWNTITVKWSVAGVGGKYVSIQHGTDAPVTGASAITQLVGTWPALTVGDPAATASKVGYFDNLKLYDVWK
jgi:hypothetical protein